LLGLAIVLTGIVAASGFTSNVRPLSSTLTILLSWLVELILDGGPVLKKLRWLRTAMKIRPHRPGKTIVSNACNGFIAANSSSWYELNDGNYNFYNEL